MVGAMSMISVAFAAATAYVADRLPMRTETLETCAGVLLIGGLALLGTALPAML